MSSEAWYHIDNVTLLDTPAVVVYLDRVKHNIKQLVQYADDVTRLRPHIKTHKSPEVTLLMLEAGIRKFKCATIAEAEMLGQVEAPDVLIAYQPVGPKISRLVSLVTQYPQTRYACLIDNAETARQISKAFALASLHLDVWIDLNVGMNRTGIAADKAFEFFQQCNALPSLNIVGLHAYDGHIRDTDLKTRSQRCDKVFEQVRSLQQKIESVEKKKLTIVMGGTPTFSLHIKRPEVECSPGTFIYWDKGYQQILHEQSFLPAALVVARVVSKPADHLVCVDLGHKSIASENAMAERVYFLNASHLTPVGHSEEHLVLDVGAGPSLQVGDVLYGIPHHICPTIALYDHTTIVEHHHVTKQWETLSRNRRITI